MNWWLGLGAIGVGVYLWDKEKGSPIASVIKENVTQKLSPAPSDVEAPAPKGSRIVGEKSLNPPTSAEFNRITNLRRRWARVMAKIGVNGIPPQQYVKVYSDWLSFGVDRTKRNLAGWEAQFRNLEIVEDWAHQTYPGWFPIRDDWSIYNDAVYADKVREREMMGQ